jgi:hypothetical protein
VRALISFSVIASIAFLTASAPAATINADFTAGNTTTSVDGYTGMAGNGWLGAWTATVPSGGTTTFSNTVSSTTPLSAGGNYLSANLNVASGAAAGGYSGTVARKFDTTVVSNSAAYSLTFKVRLDTSMANESDALNIFGDIGTGYVTTTGGNNTWLIAGYYNSGTPVWTFYDGNRAGTSTRVVTDIALTKGLVYTFVVNVDPVNKNWTVAIDNGTYVYQSNTLGFRNAATSTSGNTVYFGGEVRNTTSTLGYSVDAVALAPGVGGLPGVTTEPLNLGLNTHWRFSTDPSQVGLTQQWYAPNFNDSSWQTLVSGSSWESQGINYAGYAWYRQTLTIPTSYAGVPIWLNLADIFSDDDVYFNGVLVGGIHGNYKYDNLSDRQYTVPASAILYGQPNTIAVRIWGGNFGDSLNNDGLIAGTYTAVLDNFRVMARDTGGSNSSEVPIETYDLSAAQQGRTFEVVFRYPQSILTSSTANLTYTIKDFYGASIQTATVATTTGTDGIVRGVASISTASAQAIYLGGRFTATLLLKDGTSGATLSSTTASIDHLTFVQRDTTQLAALTPTTYDSTPYGNLKLVDTIDCSTALSTEVHPYMQSAFGNHAQDYNTPGVKVSVPVNTILSREAREPAYGWFAYRIGRGGLTPGKTYLLRIEYPEDKPRYCPIEVQSGHDYMDIGWKNGLSSTDVYDNWPLSGGWQFYDAIIPCGDESVGTGGTGDANPQNGFWVYVMNKQKPGYYFKLYSGGPAVATMRLYEIDPVANAPVITHPPSTLPQRVLMFDWERQAEQVPSDLVSYAQLMGYSAISPIMMKWATANYGDPTNGYTSCNIDQLGYWVENTANPAGDAVPGVVSVHQQYLAATKNSGVNYIPRFEYGGSNNLPTTAYAINSSGTTAQPSRFGPAWCANLLDPATFTDLQALMDSLIKPYAASNPQLKGALWRIREDRMPVSYGPADVSKFCADTGTTEPTGDSNAQLAAWASTGTVGAAYSTWWQQKRATFHQQLVNLLKSYRSDLTLYYYNWDPDKFSMMEPDLNSETFYGLFTSTTAATNAYNNDRTARASYTAADYINVMNTGNFLASGSGWSNRPDYALRPSLYSNISGMELLAPSDYLCYANQPDYLNYFQTADGLAVSNCVPYDEIASREPNPKFEGNMITPGGSPFSMALELLAYYNGDARTLTYTAYTYGRGFADAHRRFAQAFLALPAVPGMLVTGTPANVAARVYSTASNGTYIGVAYKGYSASSFTVSVPGNWNSGMTVTNLVTGQAAPATLAGGQLQIAVSAGPMELDAFSVIAPPAPVINSSNTASGTVGTAFTYTITATNNPTSFGATGLPSGLSVNTTSGAISGTPATAGTFAVTLSATSASGTGTEALSLTISAPANTIVANFTNGNSTSLADGYTGVAGSGWLGPWTTTVAGCTFNNTVATSSPLGGGGNYLSAALTAGTAAQSYPGTVGRKFDPTVVSTTAGYTVSYKIRMDSAMTIESDALIIFGDVGTGFVSNTGATNTWLISGYYNGGTPVWSFFNGNGAGTSTRTVTTMPLTVGTVYTMTIHVDPVGKSWTLLIDNGSTQYQSATLGFRNAATSGSGNTLYFGANVRNTTGTLGYSLDSLTLTPDP